MSKRLFLATYTANLKSLIEEDPHHFNYHISEADNVAERMVNGLQKGFSDKGGKACKKTCKDLNVKHTYKAIEKFLGKK